MNFVYVGHCIPYGSMYIWYEMINFAVVEFEFYKDEQVRTSNAALSG